MHVQASARSTCGLAEDARVGQRKTLEHKDEWHLVYFFLSNSPLAPHNMAELNIPRIVNGDVNT